MQSGCQPNCTGLGVVMAGLSYRDKMGSPAPYGFTFDFSTGTWVGVATRKINCGNYGFVDTKAVVTLQLQMDNVWRGFEISDTPPICGGIAQTPIEGYYAAPLPAGVTFEDATLRY
jgi:hypothetical protein